MPDIPASAPPRDQAAALPGMPAPLRTYLYAPGSSAVLLGKVLGAGADAVILDLEDAVAGREKGRARAAVGALVAERAAGAPCEVHVRINRSARGYDTDDLRAVVAPGLAGLRLPKAERPGEIMACDELLGALEQAAGMTTGSVALYPTVESAVGVLRAEALAAASARVARLGFGALDLLADLGARGPVDGPATLQARSSVVLASRAAGVGAPVDGVHPDLEDLDGLRRATTWARDLGFFGKSAIHPRQLPVIAEVFTPTAQEVERALRVVAAAEAGELHGRAALVVDGGFVDPPVVLRARSVLALSARLGGSPPGMGVTT